MAEILKGINWAPRKSLDRSLLTALRVSLASMLLMSSGCESNGEAERTQYLNNLQAKLEGNAPLGKDEVVYSSLLVTPLAVNVRTYPSVVIGQGTDTPLRGVINQGTEIHHVLADRNLKGWGTFYCLELADQLRADKLGDGNWGPSNAPIVEVKPDELCHIRAENLIVGKRAKF